VWNTTVRPIQEGYDLRPAPLPPSVLYEWFKAKTTRYLTANKHALTWDMLKWDYSHRAHSILKHLTILEITDDLAPRENELLGKLLNVTASLEHFRAPRARFIVPWLSDWNCFKLRSLDVGLYGSAPYISKLFWKVLCPALRQLCIRCESVHLGQLVGYPEHAGTASKESKAVPASSKRFPDHLKDLSVLLRQLDTLKIYTDAIPGIVTGDEFEYLRQSMDGERNLPYLASMVFVYRSSPKKDDYRDVVEALEEIRPGVEFRFIERFTTDGSL
ncbi:hypothetical protein BG000_011873, partial [Podila horticola]